MSQAAASGSAPPYSESAFLTAQDPAWTALTRSRERDECRDKLTNLGLLKPSDTAAG
jgi:thymidylate synthase (FAD)